MQVSLPSPWSIGSEICETLRIFPLETPSCSDYRLYYII
jgi:hypothetical protein